MREEFEFSINAPTAIVRAFPDASYEVYVLAEDGTWCLTVALPGYEVPWRLNLYKNGHSSWRHSVDFFIKKIAEESGRIPTRASTLREELASLLNRHCVENASDTPDFILAEYLLDCLAAFEKTSNRRAQWYGRRDAPGGMVKTIDPETGAMQPVERRSG